MTSTRFLLVAGICILASAIAGGWFVGVRAYEHSLPQLITGRRIVMSVQMICDRLMISYIDAMCNMTKHGFKIQSYETYPSTRLALSDRGVMTVSSEWSFAFSHSAGATHLTDGDKASIMAIFDAVEPIVPQEEYKFVLEEIKFNQAYKEPHIFSCTLRFTWESPELISADAWSQVITRFYDVDP